VKKISALHIILAVSLVLSTAGIWWGLPSMTGWAPDEVFPSRILNGLLSLYSNGWYDKYPPVHFYLLGLLYLPFYLLHTLHVLDLRDLSTYTVLFYIGRLVSVAMGMGTVFLVYKAGKEIFDRRAALWAALIVSLVDPFAYYAKMINADVPYVFWFALSLLFFIRILKTHERKYYLLFTAAAVLSICTKDQAYGLYVLAPLAVIFSDWRHKRNTIPRLDIVRSLFDRTYLYCLLLAAGLFFALHNILFNARGFSQHVKLIIGPASRDYRMFANTISGQLQLFSLNFRQMINSLGWPLFIVCAAGLLASLLAKKKNALLLSLLVFSLSYYIFYIAIVRYNYDRFNLPHFIILAFFGGRLISDVTAARPGYGKIKSGLLALMVLYSFLHSLSVDILMIADSRYKIERWMKNNIPREAVIGLATPAEYAPRMDGFHWRSLPLSLPDFREMPKPDYIIFNTNFSRAFEKGSPEYRFFSRFADGNPKYKLVLRHRTALRWLVIRYKNFFTNIDAINPEIQIYRRTGPETIDRPRDDQP
jgi:4-amino-4-deoxy-L-arabinose transferase-like glycosyltransferase